MNGKPSPTPRQFLEAHLAGIRVADGLAEAVGAFASQTEARPIEEFELDGLERALLQYVRTLPDGSRLLVTMLASVDSSPVCGPLKREGFN